MRVPGGPRQGQSGPADLSAAPAHVGRGQRLQADAAAATMTAKIPATIATASTPM